MAFSRSRVDLQRLKKIYSYGRVKTINATDIDVLSPDDIQEIQNDCVLVKNTAFTQNRTYDLTFAAAFEQKPFVIASVVRGSKIIDGLIGCSMQNVTATGLTIILNTDIEPTDDISVAVFALRPVLKTKTYDMNRYRFTYPNTRVAPIIPDYTDILKQLNDELRSFDAGTRLLNNATDDAISFNFTFPSIPIVVTALETSEGVILQNVTEVTTTSFRYNLSSRVNGYLHWHAFMEVNEYT